jgi:hypothetical protein
MKLLVRAALAAALFAVPATMLRVSPVKAAIGEFHTPSGNIGCVSDGGYLRCDILQKFWKSPARPASCHMRKTGAVGWTCHGDTALHAGSALAYGKTWYYGAFTCTSQITGLTCRNRSGHGFFLSKQSYRVF